MRLTEMLALYGATPFVMQYLVLEKRVPLFTALPPFLLLFIVLLALDRRFSFAEAFTRGFPLRVLAQIAATVTVGGFVLTVYAMTTYPAGVLRFPRQAPEAFQRLLWLYPLISVTTQELIYRVHFFHRYAPLFGNRQLLAVVVNAAAFALGHLFFPDPMTLAISFVGGLIFAFRYLQTRSFWAVFIEHSAFGILVFALGLGRYFYTGVPNF